jgi:hypothetical protein
MYLCGPGNDTGSGGDAIDMVMGMVPLMESWCWCQGYAWLCCLGH